MAATDKPARMPSDRLMARRLISIGQAGEAGGTREGGTRQGGRWHAESGLAGSRLIGMGVVEHEAAFWRVAWFAVSWRLLFGCVRRGFVALELEEAAQQCGGVGFVNATDDLWPVVTGWRVEYAGAVVDSAAFWVVGAEHHPADAEQADGVGAHRARFQRDDQRAIGEAGAAA